MPPIEAFLQHKMPPITAIALRTYIVRNLESRKLNHFNFNTYYMITFYRHYLISNERSTLCYASDNSSTQLMPLLFDMCSWGGERINTAATSTIFNSLVRINKQFKLYDWNNTLNRSNLYKFINRKISCFGTSIRIQNIKHGIHTNTGIKLEPFWKQRSKYILSKNKSGEIKWLLEFILYIHRWRTWSLFSFVANPKTFQKQK